MVRVLQTVKGVQAIAVPIEQCYPRCGELLYGRASTAVRNDRPPKSGLTKSAGRPPSHVTGRTTGGRAFLLAEKITHRKRISPHPTRRSRTTALPCHWSSERQRMSEFCAAKERIQITEREERSAWSGGVQGRPIPVIRILALAKFASMQRKRDERLLQSKRANQQ